MTELLKGIGVIKSQLKALPDKPGVYQMWDKQDNALYIGKAKSLKKRVASYTQPNRLSYRLAIMVSHTARMEFVVTQSEAEAFLIENQLIKQLAPRYNILLKDDKSFPYIAIDLAPAYPRIYKYRGAKRPRHEYFGPFTNAGDVTSTLAMLQKAFLLRSCKDSVFNNRSRPCLLYQIKRCCAPCVDMIKQDQYSRLVRDVTAFIKGSAIPMQEQLAKDMTTASRAQDYEEAMVLRDRLKALNFIQRQSGDAMRGIFDADVIGWVQQNQMICISVMFIRAEKLAGTYNFVAEESEEPIESFIGQFYTPDNKPKEIILMQPIENMDVITQALGVKLSAAQRGNRRALAEKAELNAKEALERKLLAAANFKVLTEKLAAFLGLEKLERIEIYDNSHIQGASAVAAMVVATSQGFDKKSYRRFNLETHGDDIASMQQVLARRLKYPNLPDLYIIDGGIAQYNAAQQALGDSACIISISESNPPIVYNNGQAVETPPELLLFIERLRDEAHRFAVGSSKSRHQKAVFNNSLDNAPHIGAARKHALLEHFGSVKAVKAASPEEIAAVPGLSKKIAKKLYDFLHE
ncbi:MAG: excinuclease ABC subunit UvrC [Alphaproteobacteria bacterium]|nr:excinuclease ABC subunit UvrC [Alphaproteobacteria bacterium]